MKTDSIFYHLFQIFPQCFFDLLELPADTSDRYQFASVEVKQLAFRIDGVFLPDRPERPIYFVEVQFQRDGKFYSRFFSEIFLYLHQTELGNNWQGAVIYPERKVESGEVDRYVELLDTGRVRRIYLDELGDRDSLGISTLKLIVSPETEAIRQGKALIRQVRQNASDARQQQELLELIETILVYKLSKINRREIEKMFSLSDLRDTRVYQEALEEGIERGIERGIEQGIERGIEQGIERGIEQGIERGIEQGMEKAKFDAIPRLLALGLSVEQIAQALELSAGQVREFSSPNGN